MIATPALTRFFRHVREEDGCWVWTGALTNGYGRFQATPERCVVAHRWIYEQLVAEIPEGLTLDHLCNRPSCVNALEHLDPVPTKINTNRGPRHNTNKTHCPSGHAYDDLNTRSHQGRRYCIACADRRNAEYRAARRASRAAA